MSLNPRTFHHLMQIIALNVKIPQKVEKEVVTLLLQTTFFLKAMSLFWKVKK